MKYALIGNIKTEAIPKAKGICRICDLPVRSYCGKIRVWHWKHITESNCDSWHENETLWHREWKNCFPESWQETIIIKGNVKHEADVFHPMKELVIEFQNSPMDVDTLIERESFYGKMLWVINVQANKNRISLEKEIPMATDKDFTNRKLSKFLHLLEKYNKTLRSFFELLRVLIFNTSNPTIQDIELKVFLDRLPVEIRDNIHGRIIQIVNFYIMFIPGRKRSNDYQTPRDIIASSPYGYNMIQDAIKILGTYDPGLNEYSRTCENILSNHNRPYKLLQEEYFFLWKRQHIVWDYSKKYLFLDLGDEYLYFVKDKLIESNGFLVKRFSKKEFIDHYTRAN